MANYALVGRCGIYCGSCSLYRAYKDRGEYLQQVSETLKMPLERIRCEGCHALTPNCAGNECKIVRCLDSKGFEYCFECSEYEQHLCQKHEELAKQCADCNVDVRTNLERIKAGEVEAWLKECKEKFKCPKCGKPLPILGWDNKKCYHCSFDLSTPKSTRRRK
jgi:hypothetical protein